MEKNRKAAAEKNPGLFRRIQWKIYSIIEKIRSRYLTDRIFKGHKEDALVLIGAPVHGNLGDHAIWIAEIQFLRDYLPGKKIIEITGNHFRNDAGRIASKTRPGDIILVTGGGFLGNLWMREELMVREVIRLFPHNRVVIFPQTIFFENNEEGRNEFITTGNLYRGHKDLHIFLRDAASYDLVTQKICEGSIPDCRLVPDIALYLNYTGPVTGREGILFCLRDDKEKAINEADMDVLRRNNFDSGYPVSQTDTVIGRDVPSARREAEVMAKINEFKKARLVITDRLHGMIFAAITGTPCMAMNNASGKVKGVFRFMEHLDYIRFIESVDELSATVPSLLKITGARYVNDPLKMYFDEIASVVKGPCS